MSTVEEIESAVSRLSPQEYAAFRNWMNEFDNKLWDKQLQEDAATGKLDSLANEALDDLKKGHCSDL